MVQENIYSARVNAVIPWAGVNRGDPNLGTAISVKADGRYLTNGNYFYQQLTAAGHRGMAVAYCTAACRCGSRFAGRRRARFRAFRTS